MSDNSTDSRVTQTMVARGLIQALTRRLHQSTTSPDVNTVFCSVVEAALGEGLFELPNVIEGEDATTLLSLIADWSEDSDLQVWTVTRATDYAQRARHVTYQLLPLDQLAAETPFCPFSPYTGELASGSFLLYLLNGYLTFEESNPAMTILTMYQEMAQRDSGNRQVRA